MSLKKSKTKATIGRIENINFSNDMSNVLAKIDSGAYRSSVWASNIHEKNGVLYFCLLGPKSPKYTGKLFSTKNYKLIEVENSFGHKQERYSVFLGIKIAGKRVKSNFTLANRGMKTYPVLIGRKLLRNRFIVDVSIGDSISPENESLVDNLD